MGTIASVLQWKCKNCNLINATECLKCLNCGNIRRILEDTTADGIGVGGSGGGVEGCNISGDGDIGDDTKYEKRRLVNNYNDGKATKTATKTTQLSTSSSSISTRTASTTWKTIASRNNKTHKTLPGYVEINSNG